MTEILYKKGLIMMEQSDLRKLKNKELIKIMEYSDKNRKDNDKLDDVYWLCVKEITRRTANGEMKEQS